MDCYDEARVTSRTFLAALGSWSEDTGPVYRRLAGAIRSAIERGEIPAGSRLPSERQLAQRLALSRTTVVSAYEVLRNEQWIESRQGSGTRVRTDLTSLDPTMIAGGCPTPAYRRSPVSSSAIR